MAQIKLDTSIAPPDHAMFSPRSNAAGAKREVRALTDKLALHNKDFDDYQRRMLETTMQLQEQDSRITVQSANYRRRLEQLDKKNRRRKAWSK